MVRSFVIAAMLAQVAAAGLVPDPNNPTYSQAIQQGKDPMAFLADAEARLASARLIWGFKNPYEESLTAKAALEAGENAKALAYATEALQNAAQLEKMHEQRGFKNPQMHSGIAEAIFYGNFVLGRLALLNGDIPSAQQYLLESGRTIGSAVLDSYGPNLSLAYELLKRGDAQSRKVVTEFIGQIRTFWKVQDPPFDKWIQVISQGGIPDFQAIGMNLYY